MWRSLVRAQRWIRPRAVVVRLLAERRVESPRDVEVERDGYRWPGFRRAWRLCDDDRGWMAHVEYVMAHEWGPGKHRDCVRSERLRLPSDD